MINILIFTTVNYYFCFYIIVFCYLLGFINTKGMTFRKGTEKHTMVSAGPLTKYAEDLTPVIKAFLGPEKSLELKIDVEVWKYLILNLINFLVYYLIFF